ncbi:Peptide methionine sulfoxide reductase A4, chloroplastic [Sarracenia purpurea var. burkii]
MRIMLLRATTAPTNSSSSAWAFPLLLTASSSSISLSKPALSLSKFSIKSPSFPQISRPFNLYYSPPKINWLGKLGFGARSPTESSVDPLSSSSFIAQGPDDDIPAPGQEFSQFGAGCFWGVELAFQRVPGVTKTEVGYSQGYIHNPTYNDVCSGTTKHSEVVRVQYDPKECSYETLLDVFWARHDPTTLNRQNRGNFSV